MDIELDIIKRLPDKRGNFCVYIDCNYDYNLELLDWSKILLVILLNYDKNSEIINKLLYKNEKLKIVKNK